MNNYKFGNYICNLREQRGLTQVELAKRLDVSDKAVSKWENGQAFPRIETFEKLADELATTVEDIFSASRDGVKRVCISNDFASVMNVDVNGKLHCIRFDESKWVEVADDTLVLKITGELVTQEDVDEFQNMDFFEDDEKPTLKDKILVKGFKVLGKKALENATDYSLQVDCTYKITNVSENSVIKIEYDDFEIADKTLMWIDFDIFYPKVECENADVELLEARGKNIKDVIKKYKKLGLSSDIGFGFIEAIIGYPLRGLYFKHLCKPATIKKNILNIEKHKTRTEKQREKDKKGCLPGCLGLVVFLIVFFFFDIFVLDTLFVANEKPYLVAADYSTIIYDGEDVYVRIDELPEEARPELTPFFDAQIWIDARTDGLSKLDQSLQDSKVQLFEDDEGRKYLWLVEDYVDTVLGTGENGEDKEYEDFDEHYVYVCENPSE